MRFPHFWRSRRAAPPNGPDDGPAAPRAGRDSGLADEVQAFLTGRRAAHLTAAGRPVPVWAVLNRLAHADRSEVVRLMEGTNVDWMVNPSSGQPPWAPAERFVAGHLLARARTPDDLGRLQRATLVPLELQLVARTKAERLTADRVLELGAAAVDSFHPGR